MMKIKLRRAEDGDGYDCLVSVGDITIGAASDDPAGALNAASGLAMDLTRAIEAHPELAALLPPQATMALKAIRMAAMAARAGRLSDVAHVLPAATRTVASILRSVL